MKNNKVYSRTATSFMKALFGKNRIGGIPNILMPNTRESLKYILRTICRSGCLCFLEPPMLLEDFTGENYECFTQWRNISNQKHLIEREGCFYPQYVLDSYLNVKLLRNIAEATDTLTYLLDNIDDYRWCYMPLSDEDSIALFLCRSSDENWILNISHKFHNVNIPYSIISRSGNQDIWNINDELKNMWCIR